MIHPLATALIAAALLAGCSDDADSDEADVTAAVEGYLTAIADRDAPAACELLAKQTLTDLEVSGSCERVLSAGLDLAAEQGLDLPEPEVTSVSVDGDGAEVILAIGSSEDGVPLVREDGEWLIAGTTSLDQLHPISPLQSDQGQGEVGD